MGHDISCSRHGVDHLALRRELGCDDLDAPDWCERYDEYQEQAYVARLSRSAGNPLNVVLYKALGVMDDETYAGCSGTGAEHKFTMAQIDTACELLETFDMRDAELPVDHTSQELIRTLGDAFGLTVVNCSPSGGDIEPERRFLKAIKAYMISDNHGEVAIQFA